jgi:hypothetical protein
MPFDEFSHVRELLSQLSKDQLLCLLEEVQRLLEEIEEDESLLSSRASRLSSLDCIGG